MARKPHNLFLFVIPMFVSVSATAWAGAGTVDYGKKVVTATGSGAPSLKAANAAVARLGAERAAKLDAFRNALEAIKGARISSKNSVGNAMEASPEVKSKVEGTVRNFKVVDTKYFSDGGVDVIVEVPLDGVLFAAAGQDAKKATDAVAKSEYTGIVIDAGATDAMPALAPRVLDEKGKVAYSIDSVSMEALRERGAVANAKTLNEAKSNPRVGSNPMVVKAVKSVEGVDLVLSAADAEKVTKAAGLLQDGRVVVVCSKTGKGKKS